MNRFLRFTFSALVVCMISGQIAIAQNEFDEHGRWINGIMEPLFLVESAYSLDQAKAFREKWKSLSKVEANENLGEWAGDYGRGDLHQAIIRISPKGGFAYAAVFTCSAELLRIDYGSAELKPSIVVLSSDFIPDLSRSGHGSHAGHTGRKLHPRYIPVKWGTWRYLIEDNRVAEFYKYVQGLDSSEEEFSFFIKRDNSDSEPEGMPILPPGYERFVRHPMKAKIVSVGQNKVVPSSDDGKSFESETVVRINAGSAQGLRKDSLLYVVGSRFMEAVKIQRVSRNAAWGVIERSVDDNKVEKSWDPDSKTYIDYPKITSGLDLISNILLAKQL